MSAWCTSLRLRHACAWERSWSMVCLKLWSKHHDAYKAMASLWVCIIDEVPCSFSCLGLSWSQTLRWEYRNSEGDVAMNTVHAISIVPGLPSLYNLNVFDCKCFKQMIRRVLVCKWGFKECLILKLSCWVPCFSVTLMLELKSVYTLQKVLWLWSCLNDLVIDYSVNTQRIWSHCSDQSSHQQSEDLMLWFHCSDRRIKCQVYNCILAFACQPVYKCINVSF